MAKILILNTKETNTLLQNGVVVVERQGLSFEVNTNREVKPTAYKGVVVNPLAFGNDRLVLTIEQGKELLKEGHTTHTKNGVTFDVYEDEDGSIYAIPQSDLYNGVLIKGEY